MGIYENFAPLYDRCMKDIPYGKWVSQIEKIWSAHRLKPGLVLELGCGTGNMAYKFAERGYDMIAIDSSVNMLSEAFGKTSEYRDRILFLQQDMQELELYGTVDAVFSVFDCMNYIPGNNGLLKVFKNVSNYLNPGGLFVFDMNTENKYIRLSDENPLSRVFPDFSYIWENTYDGTKKTNKCEAVFFISANKKGLYKKVTELHYQRVHGNAEIESAANDAGLGILAALDADTMKTPRAGSERLYYVLKKTG